LFQKSCSLNDETILWDGFSRMCRILWATNYDYSG
jgi:hypothetical protein